jgi:hypothetical protein
MRRGFLPLVGVLPLLLVLLVGAPAEADSYQGLRQVRWSWTQPETGDSYVLTARIAIQVSTDGTQGNFRFRLACTKVEANTGNVSGVRCDLQFNPYYSTHAYWVENRIITAKKKLTDWPNDFEHVWTGTQHTLRSGTTYSTGVDAFRAVFRGVHTGAWHDIVSYDWTR